MSRAINGKYIQTPEGVFELKYFFPSKISSAGDGEGLFVWDQLVVGDVVYATGQFNQARPAGAAAGQQETYSDRKSVV